MSTDIGSRLRDLAVSDSGFVFDPYTGTTFSTNAVGLLILQSLKEGADRDGILAGLRDSFEVGEAPIERDLDEFLMLLRRNGIVPNSFHL